MKRNISMLNIAVLLLLAGITACTKKLDVLDENNPTAESYFKTAAELQNGVNAVYSSMRSGNLVGREWFFIHDMRGAETSSGGAQLEAPRAQLMREPSPVSSNIVITAVWNGAYQMINRANLVLFKAPNVTDNPALRDVVVGEAKFLRAWAYFELVSQWGDVPLYTEPSTSITGYKGKSPAADIYAFIINDLTDAVQKLPVTATQKGRATKDAANALLGKVQMQKGDYGAAKAAFLQVYGKYTLVSNYLDNFDGDIYNGATKIADGHEFNSESVFEVVFFDKGNDDFNWSWAGEGVSAAMTTLRNMEFGIVWGNIIPSDQLLNEFEANDPRYKFTIYEPGDAFLTQGGTVPGKLLTNENINVNNLSVKNGVSMKRVFRKYLIIDWYDASYHPGGINQRIIRYADILLMLAECEAEVGTPSQAASYINEVRARPSVNMPPVALSSKNQALAAVMHERTVELAVEAVNNIDLLRWRKKGYFPSVKPDPRPGQVDLFPIPASEVSTNPLLQ
jgi:hypothetical protein